MRPQAEARHHISRPGRNKDHRSLGGVAAAIAALVSIAAYGISTLPGAALLVTAILAAAVVLLLVAIRISLGRFDSLPFVFIAFHGVYMLAGPLSVLAGAKLPVQFPDPPAISMYLSYCALATVGLASALTGARMWGGPPSGQRGQPSPSPAWLAAMGLLYSLVSVAGEWVNLSRGGGVALLLEGKAAVQSRIEELPLTLPTEFTATVAVGLLVWAWKSAAGEGGASRVRRRVVLGLLAMTPVLLAWSFLGRRIAVAGIGLVAVLAWRWSEPVVRVRLQHLVLLIVGYVLLGSIYAIRPVLGVAIGTGDFQLLRERVMSQDIVLQTLNPGTNEFGVTLGNVSAYLDRNIWPRQYGMTYLKGVVLPIPGFLYPGDKPKQASYEFRDLFFPGEGASGSIAGTGFSSVLEAEVNFGSAGVVGVYLCLGLLLFGLEKMHHSQQGSISGLLYLILAPKAMLFHRSAFADAVIAPLVVGAIVCLPLIMFSMLGRGVRR